MVVAPEYRFTGLSRRQLQLRCKQAGLRANTTNKEMAEALCNLARAKPANEDATPSKMMGLKSSEPKKGEQVGGTEKDLQAEADRKDVLMSGEDQDSEEAMSNPCAFKPEGLQPGSVPSLQNADSTKSAASVEADIPKGDEKQLCGVGTDKIKEPDQLAPSGGMPRKGSGSLVEELLAATACEVSVTVMHRKLAKSKHIGEKGKEDRLKRAAVSGAQNRGALLAEKRGNLAQTGGGSQGTAPLSEVAQELSKHGQPSSEAAFEAHVPVHGNPQDSLIQVAGHTAAVAVDTTQPTTSEDLPKPSVEPTVEGALLPLQTLPNEEHDGVEGPENEALKETKTGSQKENEPPQQAAQAPDGDSKAPLVFRAAADQQGKELERGSFTVSGETLLGSILAEEERAVSGQSAHKDCYKSMPFSATGLERRALAAVKKGATQREGILAERRMMP